WTAVLLASLALTVLRLGARRRETWLVMAMLALPTGWAVVIGQAQVVVTLLVPLGNPLAIALATNVQGFPALVAVWWIGRRDARSLGWFVAWMVALVLAQLVIEPAATLAYPAFLLSDQVGAVNNYSPYAISPVLWAAVVAALAVGAWRLAPKRFGWPVAGPLSVFATPRRLVYPPS